MSTTSKTYLITGANKGLGLGLVGAVLAKQPASTVIATVREPFAAKDLLALQKANAGRLEIVKLDVADEASVKAVAEEVAALPIVKENGIDALVLNAGLNAGAGSTVSTMKPADLEANLSVNLYGASWTAQYFLPLVRAGRSKRIIYVSSAVGSIGLGFFGATPGDMGSYGVSKAAGNYYFANLGRELESEGINVSLYSPGLVDTGMAKGVEIPGYKKLSVAEAADLWYNEHFVDETRPTASFFDETGRALPW